MSRITEFANARRNFNLAQAFWFSDHFFATRAGALTTVYHSPTSSSKRGAGSVVLLTMDKGEALENSITRAMIAEDRTL